MRQEVRIIAYFLVFFIAISCTQGVLSEERSGCKVCYSEDQINDIVKEFEDVAFDKNGRIHKSKGEFLSFTLNNNDNYQGPYLETSDGELKRKLNQLYESLSMDIFTSSGIRDRRFHSRLGKYSTIEIYTVDRIFGSVKDMYKYAFLDEDGKYFEIKNNNEIKCFYIYNKKEEDKDNTLSFIRMPDDPTSDFEWLKCYVYVFYFHLGLNIDIGKYGNSLDEIVKEKSRWSFYLFLLYKSGISENLSVSENERILRAFLRNR